MLRLSSLLPLPVAHALGAGLGQFMAWLPGRNREIIRVNLALCFPELGRRQRRRLAAASCRELGKQILESGIIWFGSERRLQRLVVNPEAVDTMADLWHRDRRDGQRRNGDHGSSPGHDIGLLVAGPHLGNWELCSLYVNRRFQVNNLYRPPRDAAMEPLVRELRERSGANSLPATPSGIRALYKALKRGEIAGILPDQEPRASGVFAPFFGVPAKTMTLFCQMAGKTGAPVVFMFMERLPWGRGFRLHVHRAADAIADSDKAVAAGVLNAEVERCVRLAPSQYQWSYKRFRQRPGNGDNPYKPGRVADV